MKYAVIHIYITHTRKYKYSGVCWRTIARIVNRDEAEAYILLLGIDKHMWWNPPTDNDKESDSILTAYNRTNYIS